MSRPLPVEIRVPAHLVTPLREGIAWTQTRESVVFGLVSHTDLRDRQLLLIQELVTLPEEAYLESREHGARWSGAAMIPMLNQALNRSCGVVAFHGHPHPGVVSFSGDDRRTADRLLPTFQTVVPDRPHGFAVIGDDHAAGLVLPVDGKRYAPVEKVRLLGQVLTDLPDGKGRTNSYQEDESFHRQALLTGGAGEVKLRRIKVAVVGLSGGGSHVVQQLTLMGPAEIIGIDPGRAKQSHRARVIGLEPEDVTRHRRKIEIMQRLVRRITRKVGFTGVGVAIPSQAAIDAMKEADIVVGCVDNYHARADTQELCSRYLIPYVDIGLLIRPLEGATGMTIGGNVITAIPGRFCLWCVGFLTQERLDAETGGRPRSYFEGSDGQAQVVSMNGLLASQAANEVLQLVAGFAPVTDDWLIKKYDGLAGTLQDWTVKKSNGCPKCRASLGTGDLVWRAA